MKLYILGDYFKNRFFDRLYLNSMNYGRAGFLMGRELFHGLDQIGSLYWPNGTFINESWWSVDTKKQFDEVMKCVGNLYNGKDDVIMTETKLRENIADMAGLNYSYLAFRKDGENSFGLKPELMQGLIGHWFDAIVPVGKRDLIKEVTSDHVFFLNYAQSLCTVYTPEYLKIMETTCPYSPAEVRVNVPLQNSLLFKSLWACDLKPLDKKSCNVY